MSVSHNYFNYDNQWWYCDYRRYCQENVLLSHR